MVRGGSLKSQCEEALLPHTGKINSLSAVHGGDINDNYKVSSEKGDFFLKIQRGEKQSFFEPEVKGLELLRQAAETPAVKCVGNLASEGGAYLLLEFIESASKRNDAALGAALAKVHRVEGGHFGLDGDNFIGSLPQYNDWDEGNRSWASFYIEKRLRPQVAMAGKRGLWDEGLQKKLESLEVRIRDHYERSGATEVVRPSLLHGDLWGGNVMFKESRDKGGESIPIFIDPSCYYGCREVDIAMTQLFGGFGSSFIKSYNQAYPLPQDYRGRIPWYQLYYLLAHLNLFGNSYRGSVERALSS